MACAALAHMRCSWPMAPRPIRSDTAALIEASHAISIETAVRRSRAEDLCAALHEVIATARNTMHVSLLRRHLTKLIAGRNGHPRPAEDIPK